MATKNFPISGATSSKTKEWSYTISASDINTWIEKNGLKNATIKSAVISCNCSKSATTATGTLEITVGGTRAHFAEKQITVNSYNPNQDIASFINSSNQISGDVVLKFFFYNTGSLTGTPTWTVSAGNIVFTYDEHVHSYTSKVTAPTANANGYTTYTCSCGDSYKSNYTCLVTFKGESGATLKTETINQGSTATAPTAPAKADTAQWKYTFDGWYDANGNKWTSSTSITNSTTYTARYTSTVQKYTVRWYNYDGSLLETDTNVAYGTKPTYNGATPTKAGNAEHSYQFAGWNYNTDNGITPTLGTTYIDITAQFTEIDNTYTVKWVNEGEVIETDTLVPYGAKPDYNGATPTKASDAQYDYTFIGWSASVSDPAKPEDELETVEGNVTYTAVYSATVKFYSIKVILFDSEETYVREYNAQLTIEAPTVKGYRFVKWSDGDTNASRTITVTGEATYTAIYEKLSIPIYVNDIRAKAVYVDLNNQIAFIVIDGAVPETTLDDNSINALTLDGWIFKVINTIPTGDGVKAVTQIYRNSTKVYQA